MHAAGPNNPLHGITLERILAELQAHYGWEELGRMIRINCFTSNPSIKSSLQFLRRTPWAREKVEALYVDSIHLLRPASESDAPAAPAPSTPVPPRAQPTRPPKTNSNRWKGVADE